MSLLLWYIGFVIVGDMFAYFIGLFVEKNWGSNPSAFVFVGLYFLVLWVAWVIAVRVSQLKGEATP